MKIAGICGHFGEGKNLLNGQTIKTKILSEEIIHQFGKEQVMTVDSHGGARALPRMLWQSLKMFAQCQNIVMLPAYKGLRVFTPLYTAYNLLFRRSIHYIVIGGWLDSFIEKHHWLTGMLKCFDGIYVETAAMKQALEKRGFRNIYILPNFKRLEIVDEEKLVYCNQPPYPLCTFSRVMKEKGIEDAVEAVKSINEKTGQVVYTLDIYGPVDTKQEEWFERLRQQFPEYIRYQGTVPYDKSVETLKGYFALLFPTYYEGEGFAGTLLDAMAAGVPAVASDWKYNGEIVREGVNGTLIPPQNREALCQQLERMAYAPKDWQRLGVSALKEARKYLPERAIQSLLQRLKGVDHE